MKKVIWTIGIVILLLAAPAFAGPTVMVKEINVSPRLDMTINSSGYDGGVMSGVYNIEINGVLTPSFCIDVWDISPTGDPQPYEVVALADAPDKMAGPMGGPKALDLAGLLDTYWTSGLTNVQASALQLAVWEIVDETADSYDIYNDGFSATGDAGVLSQAAWYLTNFQAASSTAGYRALTNHYTDETAPFGSYQDYVVRVPAPGAILLGAMGTGLVGWLRRRRSL